MGPSFFCPPPGQSTVLGARSLGIRSTLPKAPHWSTLPMVDASTLAQPHWPNVKRQPHFIG